MFDFPELEKLILYMRIYHASRKCSQILVSSEVSAQTALSRTSWRVGVLVVVGRVNEWDVLGKAVWAETEPRSEAEPYIEQSGD